MSSNAPSHEDAHDAHHAHSHGHEASHGSLKSYVIGFVLSVIDNGHELRPPSLSIPVPIK